MGKQFDNIMEGLNDALEFANGNTLKARTRIVESEAIKIVPLKQYSKDEIKNIRLSNSLTLKSFAACIGVSQKTVESWERGINMPSGSSSRMLQILETKPNALQYFNIIKTAG
jgi:putative transcriptional regulator